MWRRRASSRCLNAAADGTTDMVAGARLARGGVYLILRQVLGTGVSLLAMFFITRTIGAAAYGSFAATLAIVTLCHTVCLLGIPVFLLRRPTAPERSDYNIAFTLILLLGAMVMIAGLAVSTMLDTVTRLPGVAAIGAAMFLASPLVFANAIPVTMLERALDFKRIAAIELATQLSNVGVAIPLALSGARQWAPVAGWWAAICVGTVMTFAFARYRPALLWDMPRAAQMLWFGARFSASAWVFQLRQLFNPLLVGPFLGAEAVGVYALTSRIVEALVFVKAIAWRMSLAAFGQTGDSPERVSALVAKGARLQLIAMLPLLLAFSLIGPQLVTFALGRDWGATRALFPALAMGAVINSMFSLQASSLHVAGRSATVLLFATGHVTLLMAAGWLAMPDLGLDGVALAELGAFAAYPILHMAMTRVYGPSQMQFTYLFGACGAIALFWHTVGLIACVPLLCILVSPPFVRLVRAELQGLLARDGKPHSARAFLTNDATERRS